MTEFRKEIEESEKTILKMKCPKLSEHIADSVSRVRWVNGSKQTK